MSDPWISHESAPSSCLPEPDGKRLASLPASFRPREKAFAKGVAFLGPTELLALVIGTGSAKAGALATARALVRRHGLTRLAGLTPDAWRLEEGVGQALAARLAATFELGRRLHAIEDDARPRIARPKDAWRQTRDLARAKKEHLVGLYLDAQNGLIHRETISIGALNTTRSHPREIFYPAIAHLALGFVLVHNHPSGSLDPSDEDVAFTRSVQRAGETIGIELYDHVIVARNGFTSLRERGAF
jgi:DNA repair protein RadC